METKVAKKGSIITNSINREKIIPGKIALQEEYQLSKIQAEKKIEEITKLCITVLNKMEVKDFNLADAAVDLIIDKNKKIWLLEVQLNYAAEIKANRGEDEKYILPYILPTPIEYAKVLAGF